MSSAGLSAGLACHRDPVLAAWRAGVRRVGLGVVSRCGTRVVLRVPLICRDEQGFISPPPRVFRSLRLSRRLPVSRVG